LPILDALCGLYLAFKPLFSLLPKKPEKKEEKKEEEKDDKKDWEEAKNKAIEKTNDLFKTIAKIAELPLKDAL